MHPSVKYTNPNENRRNTLVVCMYYICNIYLTYLRTLNGEVWMLLEHSMLYAVVVDVVVFNLCCIAFVLMFLYTAITKWMIRGDLTTRIHIAAVGVTSSQSSHKYKYRRKTHSLVGWHDLANSILLYSLGWHTRDRRNCFCFCFDVREVRNRAWWFNVVAFVCIAKPKHIYYIYSNVSEILSDLS